MTASVKKIDHFVITTDHLTDCLSFYQTLGFHLVTSGDRYELFAGDFKINVHQKGRELKPNAWVAQEGSADFCLEIDGDLAQCKQELELQGFPCELGIVTRKGAKGEMHSIYLRDPDRNLVELCSYHPDSE